MMKKKTPKKSFTESREISFDGDDDEPSVAGETPAETTAFASPNATIDVDALVTPPATPTSTPTPARPRLTPDKNLSATRMLDLDGPADNGDPPGAYGAPRVNVDEAFVTNVGQKLYEAGAAVFFHIDDVAPETTTPEPAAEPQTKADDELATIIEPQAPPAPAMEPEVEAPEVAAASSPDPEDTTDEASTIEEAYERFQRGELKGAAVVALMERAIREGRVEQTRDLLSFQPDGDAEKFARLYFEAEYLSVCGRLLPALEILAQIDALGLTDDQKQRVWYKMAVCQRMVRDFGAANTTLTRLVETFPAREDYSRLLRTNFEQYISEQSVEAVALEKTSTLE